MNVDEEFKGTVLTDSLHITNEFECMGSLVLGMLLLA